MFDITGALSVGLNEAGKGERLKIRVRDEVGVGLEYLINDG